MHVGTSLIVHAYCLQIIHNILHSVLARTFCFAKKEEVAKENKNSYIAVDTSEASNSLLTDTELDDVNESKNNISGRFKS